MDWLDEQLAADREAEVLANADARLAACLRLMDVDLVRNAIEVKRAAAKAEMLHKPPVPTFATQMRELAKDAIIAELLRQEKLAGELPPPTDPGYKTATWRRHYHRQLDRGLCGRCGKRPPREGRQQCQGCADLLAAQRKRRLRLAVQHDRRIRRKLAERLVAALRVRVDG